MVQEKIFSDIDHILSDKLMKVNLSLMDVKDFLEEKNIPLDTKIRQPLEGEDSDNIKSIYDVLQTAAKSLAYLLRVYRELKETWQVTTA